VSITTSTVTISLGETDWEVGVSEKVTPVEEGGETSPGIEVVEVEAGGVEGVGGLFWIRVIARGRLTTMAIATIAAGMYQIFINYS
jgi:hypothetical protein